MTSANGPVFVGRAAESDLVAVRVAEGGLADAVGLGLALGWQLGLDGGGVGGLAAALAGLARGAQQPVEGGQRTEVGALVQQDGSDLSRGQVGEPLSVQRVQDGRLLRRGQRPGLHPVAVRHRRRARWCRAGPVPPVPAGLRHPGCPAGLYRFRTRRGCCDLWFGWMIWLRQDRGSWLFVCST